VSTAPVTFSPAVALTVAGGRRCGETDLKEEADMVEGERSGTVGPLERGLAVLQTVAAHPGPRVRPADLARATGLARSTVDRVVTTLVRVGYLRTEGRDVVMAPRLMELGNAYLAGSGLREDLEPHAVRLAGELDESVTIAVPDGDGVRFVSQATRSRRMSLAVRIGDLLPAERCAPGALFAAGWTPQERAAWRDRLRKDPADAGFPAVPPRTEPPSADEIEAAFERRTAEAARVGWSADDQLIEPGLIAVAVPVRDGDGRVVCAVSVVSHTSRHTVASLAELALPRLRGSAAAMEAGLAHGATGDPAAAAARGHHLLSPALKEELGPEFLQSLARGLAVLAALGPGGLSHRGGLTLTAVAQATGLPRATARRALLTLRELGYVGVRGDGRRFFPRPSVLGLGYARLSGLGFAEIVQPHLARLVERVQASASMAVLDGDDIVYVARVPTVRIMSVTITLGTRFPAYATSMGRVLLAGLPPGEREARLAALTPRPLTPRTRTSAAELARAVTAAARDGHALVDQELEEGVSSIAVPVHDPHGRVTAALNVATHAGQAPALREQALPALREAAAAIEADLAVTGVRPPEQGPEVVLP
jgi:IclR family transcriptional regulator, pca regulon regulatory protein